MEKHVKLGDPNPQPNIVRVSLPADIAYDLGKLQEIQKDILGRLGCMACCSGWDIRWDVFRNYSVDSKGHVHEMLHEIR